MENGAPEISDPSRLIRQDVLQFMAGTEIRSLYEQVFDTVRLTQKPTVIPFRCDAPEVRRYMRLVIQPLPDKMLRVDSIEDHSEERHAVDALRGLASDTAEKVEICSVCRRVKSPDGRWDEPERVLVEDQLFVKTRFPKLVERVCHQCSVISRGCDYILTGSDDDHVEKPAVVFLHGMLQGEWLLRLQAPPRFSDTSGEQKYLLISPILRTGERWDITKLNGMVRKIAAEKNVDLHSIHGTGVSAGAAALWRWAMQGDIPWASLVPVSTTLWVPVDPVAEQRMRQLPIWSFVAQDDPVVPIDAVKRWYSSMQRLNPETRMTVFEKGGHDIWSQAYRDESMWRWMLSH